MIKPTKEQITKARIDSGKNKTKFAESLNIGHEWLRLIEVGHRPISKKVAKVFNEKYGEKK